jgi:16S rRNA processing protein RimM
MTLNFSRNGISFFYRIGKTWFQPTLVSDQLHKSLLLRVKFEDVDDRYGRCDETRALLTIRGLLPELGSSTTEIVSFEMIDTAYMAAIGGTITG